MKIKTVFACLVTMMIMSGNCLAQGKEINMKDIPRNDIRLSYGMMTMGEMSLALNELMFGIFFIAPFSQDSVLNLGTNGYGAFSFQYQYRVSKVISIGGLFSFNPGVSEIRFNKKTSLQMANYFMTLMPRVDFTYVNKGIFSMYSGFAIGVTYAILKINYSDQTDVVTTGWTLGMQLNFIGIRIGKDIGGFAEFGFGSQGLVNFGISAKL